MTAEKFKNSFVMLRQYRFREGANTTERELVNVREIGIRSDGKRKKSW